MAASVSFQIKDIVHPSPAEVLSELYQEQPLKGEVITHTSDGHEPLGFVVVRVNGVAEPVIVPARKTWSIPSLKAESSPT